MEQTVHPKHAAAIAAAKFRRAEVDNLLAAGKTATEEHGLKFIHFMPEELGSPRFGGMTVAYKPLADDLGGRQNVYAVATALCKPTDNYSKKLGRAYAALSFDTGNSILLFIPDGFTAHDYIASTFQPIGAQELDEFSS